LEKLEYESYLEHKEKKTKAS